MTTLRNEEIERRNRLIDIHPDVTEALLKLCDDVGFSMQEKTLLVQVERKMSELLQGEEKKVLAYAYKGINDLVRDLIKNRNMHNAPMSLIVKPSSQTHLILEDGPLSIRCIGHFLETPLDKLEIKFRSWGKEVPKYLRVIHEIYNRPEGLTPRPHWSPPIFSSSQ